MFTKKFTFALLLTPLFVGCVVGGDGDTDADTDPGTGSSVSVSTDDSTGASSVSADTGPSSATEDTGPATGDETAGPETGGTETGGGGGGMFCQQACMEAADCCQPGTEGMCPGDFPFNVECTDGTCEYGSCTSDPDCEGLFAGTSCRDVGAAPTCVPLCTVETEDVDCITDMDETCTGMTDDGDLYCIVEPMACTPKTCGDDFVCNEETGFCECDGDDDCGGIAQGGSCNLETGACNCTDDASCGEGFTCVAF